MANIISLSRITKEDWYKYKDALYRNDLFVVELDASYKKGILHFTHELSLVFYLEDNQLQLIEGNEIGPEYSEFDSGDWKYLKEKFCISDEFIISKIKDFINQTAAWDSSGAESVAKQ